MLLLPLSTLAVVLTQLFHVGDHSKSTEGQNVPSYGIDWVRVFKKAKFWFTFIHALIRLDDTKVGPCASQMTGVKRQWGQPTV